MVTARTSASRRLAVLAVVCVLGTVVTVAVADGYSDFVAGQASDPLYVPEPVAAEPQSTGAYFGVHEAAAYVLRTVQSATALGTEIAGKLASARHHATLVTPGSLESFAVDFVRGAVSIVCVGQSLSHAAAGFGALAHAKGLPMPGKEGYETAVYTHTTSKFAYGIGVAFAELLLLKLLYREPHGNRRVHHSVLARASSPKGFLLLTATFVLTDLLGPVSVLVVIALHLSDAVYMPVIVLSGLVRPYLVAALLTCPCLHSARHRITELAVWALEAVGSTGAGSHAADAAYRHRRRGHRTLTSAVAEYVLWGCVTAAVLFIVRARNTSSEVEWEELDDGATAEAAEEPLVQSPRAAAKARPKKAAPARRTSTPRAASRSQTPRRKAKKP